jgi:hypothetical protein
LLFELLIGALKGCARITATLDVGWTLKVHHPLIPRSIPVLTMVPVTDVRRP